MEVLKRLQTSVTRAFDESFDDAYRHLNADLALRDAKVSEAELAHDERMKALAKVEELERDISALQTELRQYTNGLNDVEDSVTMTKDLLHQAYAPEHVLAGTVDSQNGHSPLPKRAVEAKYRALYSDAQKLAEANNRLRTEHGRQKKKLLRLQQYIGRDEFTVVLDGGHTVTFRRVQRISNGVDYKNKMQPRIPEPNAGQLGPSNQRSEIEASTKKFSPSTRIVRESNGSELRTNVANVTDNDYSIRLNSDQLDLASTQSSDSSGPEGAVLGHSSGAPIAEVLHVRKRKQTPLPESRHMYSQLCDTATNESSERPVFIKSESVSPSPLQSPLRDGPLISAGTQDLDDIGVAIGTPEKRTIYTHRTPFSTRDIPMPTSDLNDSDHHSRGQQQRIGSEPSKRSTVLQPIDGNAQAPNRFDFQTDFKKRKVLAIPSITEDGDESYLHFEGGKATSMLTHNRELERLSATSTAVYQRLENLLNGPSPSKSPLPFPKSPKGLPPHSHDGRIERDSSIQHNISTSNGATKRPVLAPSEADNTYNPRRINVGNELSERLSEDRTHRSGLTHRPDLSGFRINPAKNQGLDFPYKSVVRKKDERKCLPGCVSEDCCGPKFRRIARSLPCTEDEARKIVEDYLGDERHILSRISDDERERILLDARAWSLANRYGRHRQNHQRAPSPPGFWRTEMPDTQELRHDHEEAEKIEQEVVMARRREAMRPGGLWEFVDQ